MKQFYAGTDVLSLSDLLATTALEEARKRNLSPKDAREALNIAAQVALKKKASYETLLKNAADAYQELHSTSVCEQSTKQVENLILIIGELLGEGEQQV